jgi:hypothetical protein
MVTASVAREIEGAVRAALRSRDTVGEVVVKGESLELHADGVVVAVDLGEWIEQWAVIPPDMRDRRAVASAVRLEEALAQIDGGAMSQRAPASLRAGGSGGRAPRRGGVVNRSVPGSAGIVLDAKNIAIGGVLLVLISVSCWWFLLREPEPERNPIDYAKAEETARLRRVCEAGRQQIYSGAAMAVDSAGWVVELWLAKKAGEVFTAEAVAEALAAETVTRALGNVPEGRIETVIDGRTATLRFDDAYVAPLFSTSGRPLYVSLAARLTKATKAHAAALYAKCAHLSTHDVGAWFWGSDKSHAALALLFVAGVHGQPPALKRQQLGPDPLAAIERRVAQFEPRALPSAVTHAGGRLSSREPEIDPDGLGGTAVNFPITGPTRAGRASRALVE